MTAFAHGYGPCYSWKLLYFIENMLDSVENMIYVTKPIAHCGLNHPTHYRSSKPLLGVLALTRPLSSLVWLVTRLGTTAQPEEGTRNAYVEIWNIQSWVHRPDLWYPWPLAKVCICLHDMASDLQYFWRCWKWLEMSAIKIGKVKFCPCGHHYEKRGWYDTDTVILDSPLIECRKQNILIMNDSMTLKNGWWKEVMIYKTVLAP